MRSIGVESTALGGLNREFLRLDRSAGQVVQASASEDGFEPVAVSAAAREAAGSGNSPSGSGLEGALADLRVSKYLAIANMKVLKTSQELGETLEKILK
jgi:hypothetical protein